MAPERAETRPDAITAARAGEDRGRPRRFRPSQFTVLITVGALGLNLAALAIVLSSVTSTRDEVLDHLAESRNEPTVEVAEDPRFTEGGRVNELMAIAEQLEQSGESESARQVRAAAQRILVARSEEDGAFEFACRLLESGHAREARRALYRILARSDQPGTRWAELGTQARFLIGRTLSAQADAVEVEHGGDR